MKKHPLLLLLLFSCRIAMAQEECLEMMPRIMGLESVRSYVDLEDVEVQTLPLVFHIVHTGSTEDNNISNEQVLSQVEALNEEFADSKIQFCMAARDPEGNPTNGINRYDASWNDEYMADGVSSGLGPGWSDSQMKAASGCWNPDQYINFYVVSEINGNNAGNGVQGYAYLGPTNDCRDGIVCLYNTTGTEGVLKPGRTLGFTGVHEAGHYLSLYHTFSNSNDCVETNCETQGDQVCDTPPTLSNTACTNPSCPDALTDNFMDYTLESCKESFTVGQAERMHECLLTQRSGLLDNLACVPLVTYDVTPGQAYYQETWCTPYQDIWVDVINQGTETQDWVEVQLYCNGDQYIEVLFNMEPGVQSVLFEGVYVDGAQMFEVQTMSMQEEYTENDYAWYNISTTDGDYMHIEVKTDTWANETSWNLYDEDGFIVTGDQGYPIGVNTYEYDVCVYEGCYEVVIEDSNGDGFCSIDFDNNGICDIGEGYLLATIGPDTVFYTGQGAIFDTYQQEFCNTLPACELDYDGNGVVGNGDILVMLSYMGCTFCPVDPNQDGIVNVYDLLYMLWNVGDCPVEQDFSVGTYKTFFDTPQQFLPVGKPRIYDITGRKVEKPFDELPTGVYILKWKGYTKKVFVQ